jgi:hypothetical protein
MGSYSFPFAESEPEVFPHKNERGASGGLANEAHFSFTPFPGQ